jgi:hypothetical protein
VQVGHPVGIPGSQTRTQGLGEEVVVAVPPPLVVEGTTKRFSRSRVSSMD